MLRARVVWAVVLMIAAAPQGSVYRVDPWIDGVLTGAGAATSALAYAFSSELIRKRCPCDPGALNALDRSVVGQRSNLVYWLATAGTGLAIAAPLAKSAADLGRTEALLEDALVYAETLAFSAASVSLAKHAFQRPLPLVYDDPHSALANRAEGYRSFYSGHTAHAVALMTAFAMTETYRHGPSAWPWLLDGLAATAIGAGVIASGRHFYTDVLAGGAIGLATGALVPMLHHRAGTDIQLSLAPIDEGALLTIRGTL